MTHFMISFLAYNLFKLEQKLDKFNFAALKLKGLAVACPLTLNTNIIIRKLLLRIERGKPKRIFTK